MEDVSASTVASTSGASKTSREAVDTRVVSTEADAAPSEAAEVAVADTTQRVDDATIMSQSNFIGLPSGSAREEIAAFSNELLLGEMPGQVEGINPKNPKRAKISGNDFQQSALPQADRDVVLRGTKRPREEASRPNPLLVINNRLPVSDTAEGQDGSESSDKKPKKFKKSKASKKKQAKKRKDEKKKKSKKHRKRSTSSSSFSSSSSEASSAAEQVFRVTTKVPENLTQAELMTWAKKHPGHLGFDTMWEMHQKVGREGETVRTSKIPLAVAKTYYLHSLAASLKKRRNRREAYTLCTLLDHIVLGRCRQYWSPLVN